MRRLYIGQKRQQAGHADKVFLQHQLAMAVKTHLHQKALPGLDPLKTGPRIFALPKEPIGGSDPFRIIRRFLGGKVEARVE